MKKGIWTRVVSLLLGVLFAFGLAGCDFLEEWYAEESGTESADSESSDGSDTDEDEEEKEAPPAPKPLPKPQEPDPEKTVLKYETDAIGHKVAYYTDGTYDDLGRVVPLDFASPDPETQYGYQSLAAEYNGASLCKFYKDLYAVSTEFHNSEKTLSVVTEAYEGETYEVAELTELDYGKYGMNGEQALAVWKIFGDENPLFYWMDIYVDYSDGAGKMTYYVDPAYASYTIRRQANAAIEEMALECDSYLSGLTTIEERALTIYDYIIGAIDYAYDDYGYVVEESWAYNIAGGAMKGYGVCECYAETYAYFCGLFGLDCLNVVGMAGEEGAPQNEWGPHAWNYVRLNEKWYAVDATWADYPDDAAFDGGDVLLRNYFGIERAEYAATHKADLPVADWTGTGNLPEEESWGVAYQCPLPTLSGELSPVRLTEENGESKIVGSLDEAFALMTNEGGRYEITLYPQTTVTEATGLIIYPKAAEIFTATTLPKVAYLTIKGSDAKYSMELLCDHSIKLQSNVTLDGVDCNTASWNKNGYSLRVV